MRTCPFSISQRRHQLEKGQSRRADGMSTGLFRCRAGLSADLIRGERFLAEGPRPIDFL